MKYILAVYYNNEGWYLEEYDTKEDLLNRIKDGNIHGEIKVLKELDLNIHE